MKLNKLLLSTTLVPIAVIPAITTSCHDPEIPTADKDHLLTYYADEDVYTPVGCHSEEPATIHYASGKHTFLINNINSKSPVFDFILTSPVDPTPWYMDKTDWSVSVNGKDQTEKWELNNSENNYISLRDPSNPIKSGYIMFTVNITAEADFTPVANYDS